MPCVYVVLCWNIRTTFKSNRDRRVGPKPLICDHVHLHLCSQVGRHTHRSDPFSLSYFQAESFQSSLIIPTHYSLPLLIIQDSRRDHQSVSRRAIALRSRAKAREKAVHRAKTPAQTSPLKDDSGIRAGSMIDFFGPGSALQNDCGLALETIRSQRQTCSTGVISSLRSSKMGGPSM